jgi:Nucleoside-diphosphate-sugar epimerases
MIKVLVIGSNSYIGKKFKEYIIRMNISDISVDLVGAKDGSWRKVNFTCYDVVLHLAAIVHMKEKGNMEKLYNDINHLLAVEVAQKAKDNGVRQFIFMSTAAVYGKQNGCITKETLPMPNTFYGKSKLLAEKEIIKLQDKKFIITVIRPPMVYGEGCKGNYKRLVKVAKFAPIFPDYHNKRSKLNVYLLSIHLIDLIRNERNGIFHPQDNEFMDTCEELVSIRRNAGKRTVLISCFNNIIRFFINFNIIWKIFGNFYYDKNIS